LGEDGDLTETRNYAEYILAFDEGAERKYEFIKPGIKPGRIVDIGCETGSILKQMSNDQRIRESDLYGIEVSRKLYSLCEQRKENGEFGHDHVFFYQRNIVKNKIFSDNSIDTFTALSLTHELESYVGRETLLAFIKQIYEQLAPGGMFINYDVTGPGQKDKVVYMELTKDDGITDGWDKLFDDKQGGQVKTFLESLSTYARFLRFAKDFRSDEGYELSFTEEVVDGKSVIKLRAVDAAEFLSKKDYTNNWYSEMHETFCFWSFADWKMELEKVGFNLQGDSRVFTNEWVVSNRYEGKVMLYEMDESGRLVHIPYPPTNVVLYAQKV